MVETVTTASKYENIPVFENTKKLVDNFGKKGETYDNLIRRLLKIAKGVES